MLCTNIVFRYELPGADVMNKFEKGIHKYVGLEVHIRFCEHICSVDVFVILTVCMYVYSYGTKMQTQYYDVEVSDFCNPESVEREAYNILSIAFYEAVVSTYTVELYWNLYS